MISQNSFMTCAFGSKPDINSTKKQSMKSNLADASLKQPASYLTANKPGMVKNIRSRSLPPPPRSDSVSLQK